MPKCDFNKVALQLHFDMDVNLLHSFRIPFLQKNSWWLLLLYVFSVLPILHSSSHQKHELFIQLGLTMAIFQ